MGSIPIARSTPNSRRSLICKRKSQPLPVGFFLVWSISGLRRGKTGMALFKDDIEMFYQQQRRHGFANALSPLVYGMQYFQDFKSA
ncbi:hypothetical protein [Aquitalea magnusonii]|nr:hypothetical protein [Aquitalea magnusonii]